MNVKNINLDLVARLSSRIFLGEELCRSEDWLKITVNYTVDLMFAAEKLRHVPGPLRWIAHWFLPEAQKLRAEVKQAGDIIRPVLEKRRREKAMLQAQGKESVEYYDAVEWFEQAARAKGCSYNPEVVQLFLSTVAIHTTSDLLTVTMLDIARNPHIIEPLREEMTSILKNGGWKKTSLNDLKLLDSVIKESLRLKPIGIGKSVHNPFRLATTSTNACPLHKVSMRRVATSGLKLDDGTYLPKGSKVVVSSHRMWDPAVYDNPGTWDGARFLRLRDQPNKNKEALFVSTSERHLGFGHGKHGCPGRFFAASELKVALCHILLKYDLCIAQDAIVQHRLIGASYYADPAAKLLIRRRKEIVEI